MNNPETRSAAYRPPSIYPLLNSRPALVRLQWTLARFWSERELWLERFLALEALLLGIFVALPFTTSSPPFQYFFRAGGEVPEAVSGAALIICGLWQLRFLWCDTETMGNRCQSGRAVGTFIGIVLWDYLSINTLLNQPVAALWVIYALNAGGWTVILFKQPLVFYDRWFDRFDGLKATAAGKVANTVNGNVNAEK